MKTKLILLSAFLSAAALAFTLTAYAAIPHLMNYQGKATDKTGAPLSGTYNLKFRIYNTETAGTPKWTETQVNIPISNGIFQVQLGSVTPLNLPFDESYWISIEINTDGEMSPRTRLASVGYAYMAETSNTNVMPVGSVVQVVNYQRSDSITGTTGIPYDDTIPQNTEGDEYLTLSITPKSATNKLKIDVVICGAATGSPHGMWIAALFQDSVVNSLCGQISHDAYANWPGVVCFTYYMTAQTISLTTFKVRAGWTCYSGTFRLNGRNNRMLGGVNFSSITITEIKG